MALAPKKYTIRRLYESSRKIQFDFSLAQLRIVSVRFFRILVQGIFFRSDLLRDEYDTTYHIIKKNLWSENI